MRTGVVLVLAVQASAISYCAGWSNAEAHIICGRCGKVVDIPLEGEPPKIETGDWGHPFWKWLQTVGNLETKRCQYAATMRHGGRP